MSDVHALFRAGEIYEYQQLDLYFVINELTCDRPVDFTVDEGIDGKLIPALTEMMEQSPLFRSAVHPDVPVAFVAGTPDNTDYTDDTVGWPISFSCDVSEGSHGQRQLVFDLPLITTLRHFVEEAFSKVLPEWTVRFVHAQFETSMIRQFNADQTALPSAMAR